MIEVVSGVDDDCELVRPERAQEPEGQIRAANTSTQRQYRSQHLNMSISRGLTSADAGTGSACQLMPRTCTAGSCSSASPINSDAAEAI